MKSANLLKAVELIKETCEDIKGYCPDCPMYEGGHCKFRGEPWTWDVSALIEWEDVDE